MTMQDQDNRLGQVAYEAFAMQSGGVSLASGDALPMWVRVPEEYRTAWIAAARAVIANAERNADEPVRRTDA